MPKQSDLLNKVPRKAPGYASRKDASSWTIPLPLLDKVLTTDDFEAKTKTMYEVPINPAEPTKGTFTCMIVHINGNEDLRGIIQWKKDIESIVTGKGIEKPEVMVKLTLDRCTGAPRNSYEAFIEGQRATRQLAAMELANNPPVQGDGEAARVFTQRLNAHNAAVEQAKALTKEDHTKALQQVIEDASPNDVLAQQIRMMKHEMKKPYDLKVKAYVSMLLKINLLELPELPPFAGKAQSLSKADLVEIVRYGVPQKWQHQLRLQNFDTSKHTFQELIKFMEAQEEAEESIPQSKKKSKHNYDKNKGEEKWCAIHHSHTHNTEDCRDNKKNKNNKPYKKTGNQKNNSNHGNKTWSRQSDENKKFTQAEVNSLVAKEVKKAKATWTTQNKKRKNNSEEEANMVILDSDTESINSNPQSTSELNKFQLKLSGIDLDDLDKVFEEHSNKND